MFWRGGREFKTQIVPDMVVWSTYYGDGWEILISPTGNRTDDAMLRINKPIKTVKKDRLWYFKEWPEARIGHRKWCICIQSDMFQSLFDPQWLDFTSLFEMILPPSLKWNSNDQNGYHLPDTWILARKHNDGDSWYHRFAGFVFQTGPSFADYQ